MKYSLLAIDILLAGITPGRWLAESNEVYQRSVSRSRRPILCRPDANGLADAAFIAAAPDLVRQLQELLQNESAATETTPSLASKPSTAKGDQEGLAEAEDSTADSAGQRLCTACGNVPAYFCSQLCADRWAGK